MFTKHAIVHPKKGYVVEIVEVPYGSRDSDCGNCWGEKSAEHCVALPNSCSNGTIFVTKKSYDKFTKGPRDAA